MSNFEIESPIGYPAAFYRLGSAFQESELIPPGLNKYRTVPWNRIWEKMRSSARKIEQTGSNSIKDDFEKIQNFYDLPIGCKDIKNIIPNCNDYLPEGKKDRRAEFRNRFIRITYLEAYFFGKEKIKSSFFLNFKLNFLTRNR